MKKLAVSFMVYAVMGGVATLVDWGSFYVMNYVLGLYYIFAVCISFTLGSLTNFILNKYITFKNKSQKIIRQYVAHFSISAFALGFTVLIMYLLVGKAGTPNFTARVITTLIMLLFNYVMHKNITFGVYK